MQPLPPSHPIDVAFSVPFVHRLRFTGDVLEHEQHVLVDLLEGSGDGPAARPVLAG